MKNNGKIKKCEFDVMDIVEAQWIAEVYAAAKSAKRKTHKKSSTKC